jgi:hypothetical protein
VRDLENDGWVRWQHRNYVPLGLGMGFGLPPRARRASRLPVPRSRSSGPPAPHRVPRQPVRTFGGSPDILAEGYFARQLLARAPDARRRLSQFPSHLSIRLSNWSALVPLGPHQMVDPMPGAPGARVGASPNAERSRVADTRSNSESPSCLREQGWRLRSR